VKLFAERLKLGSDLLVESRHRGKIVTDEGGKVGYIELDCKEIRHGVKVLETGSVDELTGFVGVFAESLEVFGYFLALVDGFFDVHLGKEE
jgi:hypothetical protein